MYATTSFNLATNYDNSFDITTAGESVFIDFALNPIIKAVLPINHKLERSGHFTSLEDEADFKPDMKFYITIDGIRFNCLLKSNAQTVHVEMICLKHGVNNPVVYGVLVYGFTCSMYEMSLVAPKVYVMVQIRKYLLPRCPKDFYVATSTLCSFLQLRDLVCEQVQLKTANKQKISGNLGQIHKPKMGIKQ